MQAESNLVTTRKGRVRRQVQETPVAFPLYKKFTILDTVDGGVGGS